MGVRVRDGGEEQDAEFGTVATWTADAVAELGDEYAIVAGCRGSGDPALLDWLAKSCGLSPSTHMVDVGAGVGGASAWAAEEYGVRPVLVEPMEDACRAERRIFGRTAVCGSGDKLPFDDQAFDVAWCVGVLCTVHDKVALLREIRRVLRPGGSLGMLVLVAEPGLHSELPRGNEFPDLDELRDLLAHNDFDVRRLTEAAGGAEPAEWSRQARRVDELLAKTHGDDPRWQEAEEQSGMLAHLLKTRQLTRRLVHAVRG
jgi:SAM-dependent methyltransferase